MSDFELLHQHIESILPRLTRQGTKKLPFPTLGVGYGQHYAGFIYCWDNHHMSLRFAAGGHPEQMRFFLGNMLACQTPSGFIPSVVNMESGGIGQLGPWHAQPWLAQNAAIYTDLTDDKKWAEEIFSKLEAYLRHWTDKHATPLGLFRWREPWHGHDNEITSIFVPDSIIPPELNSLLCLEFQSMAFLAGLLGDSAGKTQWQEKADALKDAINQWLWDDCMGTYAAYDLITGECRIRWATTLDGDGGTLSDEEVGKYAFLSSPGLYPLYAGIAPSDRAERMIRNFVLSPDHFRSRFGIRSLAKSSEFYNQARWGNPCRFGDHRRLTNSNWQGPVWFPLNWFVFHALLRYGFRTEARALADDTAHVLAKSIKQFGFMRECYDAESGEGLYADHFASWNILADLMPQFLTDSTHPFRLFPWLPQVAP